MGCGCSNKGKIKPQNQNNSFLDGQLGSRHNLSYDLPTHSMTINGIDVIPNKQIRYSRTFADRVSWKRIQSPQITSTQDDTWFHIPQNFLPFKPEKIILNLKKIKKVNESLNHPLNDSICSGSLTNAAWNFYVRDSISEFTFRPGQDAQRFTFNPNSRQTTNSNLRDDLRKARRQLSIHSTQRDQQPNYFQQYKSIPYKSQTPHAAKANHFQIRSNIIANSYRDTNSKITSKQQKTQGSTGGSASQNNFYALSNSSFGAKMQGQNMTQNFKALHRKINSSKKQRALNPKLLKQRLISLGEQDEDAEQSPIKFFDSQFESPKFDIMSNQSQKNHHSKGGSYQIIDRSKLQDQFQTEQNIR